jgi:hypothetical protein
MKHTLRDVTFEVPDDLPDFSEYTYRSPDGDETLAVQPEGPYAGDANALLDKARANYEGTLGSAIIYSSPKTFYRAGKARCPAVEGERRDPLVGRVRFALFAVASAGGSAVVSYTRPSRPLALQLLEQVIPRIFVLGEPRAENRPIPKGWTRRQADALLFALPGDWTGPQSLVFRSALELRIRFTEPAVPAGTIDLSRERDREAPETATTVQIERVAGPGLYGWTGEWQLSGGKRAPGDMTILRKMSVTVSGRGVVTAYGKTTNVTADRLQQAWAQVRQSLRAAGKSDG